jgi:YD repeat-containing protein
MKILSILLLLIIPFLSSGQIIKSTINLVHTINDSTILTIDKTETYYDSSGNITYSRYSYSKNNLEFISAGSHKAKYENGRLRYFEFYGYLDSLIYYEYYTESDSIEISQRFIDTTHEANYRHYNEQNQLIHLKSESNNTYLTYNNQGKILTQKNTSSEGIFFINYSYDNKGNVISISTPNGSITIEYLEFNSNGDWINSKETHNFDDEKITLSSREIVYY